MNYYRRYVGDYLKKTIRLTMAGHGAYGLMLDYYYAEELPLPLDMDDVYAIARAASDADRKVVDKVLAAYFTKAYDGYHNERADEEIGVAGQARLNGAKAGKRTGRGTGIGGGEGGDLLAGQGGGSGHPPTTTHQPPSSNLKPPPSAGRASRLPTDWTASPEQLDFCKTERPDLIPHNVEARFRDYWVAQPGQRGVKIDWSATWRNWVRNEKPGPGKTPGKQSQLESHNADTARRFAEKT